MSTKGQGEQFNWLRERVGYQGDECLIWPFRRLPHTGYGLLIHDGKQHYANRLMCELAKGPPPAGTHYAAHSCGNGHLGCVNPKHLDWKTPTDNQLDSVAHGRATGGPGKLTPEKVARIKALKGVKGQLAIAAEFGIAQETVSQIHRGIIWPDRPRRPSNVKITDRAAKAARARELRAGGASYQKIAEDIGVSRLSARVLANESA